MVVIDWKNFRTLDELAPRKKKCRCGNNMPFVNKTLSMAHMKRTSPHNRFRKKQISG